MGLTTLEEVLRVAPPVEAHILPPRSASFAASAPAAPMRTPPPSRSVAEEPLTPALKNILVLEDNADTQALLKLLLEKNGYLVTIAGDGNEALMYIGRQEFDLILSDINMPNMDGIQLLDIKNKKQISLPIILLTANDSEECEKICLEMGAIDYIKKPIKKDILLLRIKKALSATTR